MPRKFLLVLSSLIASHSGNLCVDQPVPSLFSGIGDIVHVEASQVESAQDPHSLCDSTQGPFCGRRGKINTDEFLSKALGIPSQIALYVPPSKSVFTSHYSMLWNKFSSVRPISRSHLETAKLNFTGSWAKTGPNPAFAPNAQVSFTFDPAVVQNIQFSPPNAHVIVVGRLKGQPQWRKVFSSQDSPHLLGSDVFAIWKGNGSVHRATVLTDTASSLHVAWRDGDQSFRAISPEDVVTVVPGTVETLRTIDQLVFFAPPRQGPHMQEISIAELVLSVGPASVPNIRIFRSGGGLVFEDDVSAGAVLYSATDLVERNLRVIDSGVTSSSVFGSKLAHALMHKPADAEQLQIPRTFISPIMLSLFLAQVGYANEKILKIHSIFASFINRSVVPKYLNFDEMFNAFLDSAAIKGGDMLSLRLQSWLKDQRMVLLRPTIAPNDTFEGTLVCSGDLARNLKVSILTKARRSSQISDLTVSVRLGVISHQLNAEFNHIFGLVYIPATASWPYPLSLYLVRVDTLTLVELVGSVNYVSCGGLIMQPTSHSTVSVAAARSVPLDGWAESVKNNQVKFNAILHPIKSKLPFNSHGSYQPFITRNEIDIDA